MTEHHKTYAVATIKPWNIKAFHASVATLPGQWVLFESERELTLPKLEAIKPDYIFFPHWSWKVPSEIYNQFTCICFHMADVPYGRGGSPLQNLISRGHKETQLSALKMEEALDAGPVYCKRSLSLLGRAQDIYERMAHLVYEEIRYIIQEQPQPRAQSGDVVEFSRRKPEQSHLPERGSMQQLYDHIRMLDAETYPKACLHWKQWQLLFETAQLDSDSNEIVATVRISANKEVTP